MLGEDQTWVFDKISSPADPSFSCTIRKLLIAAILLGDTAAGVEPGLAAVLSGVWERSHGASMTSIPTARTTHKFARKLQRDRGCRNPRLGGQSFSGDVDCFDIHSNP